MSKYTILLLIIIFIISCNSNNENPKKSYTAPQSNQVIKSEIKKTTVTFDEARKFVQDRIAMRNGRIIDEFINNSYEHKIYIFLTEYGSEPCNISVSEIELSILATKCGQEALAYFYAAKMTSSENDYHRENTQTVNDNRVFSLPESLKDTNGIKIFENESTETEFSEYEPIVNKGKYVINATDNQRVYFHKSPNIETKKNAYFITGEIVIVEKIENGFGYVEFINTRGQKSVGWIEMQSLTKF